jgi:FG-GAP-like repeat/Abnormal spindle-like microcephaly-assoc'd, ASPM-SPD-2-Hydin
MRACAFANSLLKRFWPIFFAPLILLPNSVRGFAQTPPPVSFVARMDYAVSSSPQSIAVGDLRADGNLDVVTVGSAGDVSVLLNKGDGTFQPSVEYSAPANNLIIVQLSDFNGDGKPDILVAAEDANTAAIDSVSVFLGNGDGTFQAPKLTTISNSNCRCIAVGDFNGDGKSDLAIPVLVPQLGESAVTVMVGNGDGTFQAPITANVTPFPTPSVLQVADMNGDGRLDLVSGATSAGEISVLLGNGDGTFQQPKNTIPGLLGTGLVIADFTGDGKLDVACDCASSSDLAVFPGNGDGTFQTAIVTPIEGVVFLYAADLNGDGNLDLVGEDTTYPASVVVALGNGDGTFQAPALPTGVPGLPAMPGDFNKDGKLDLVAASLVLTPSVSVAFGNGDGTFQVDTLIPDPGDGRGYDVSIAAGDFTGDGITDLLPVYSANSGPTGPYSLYVGNGDGTFTLEKLPTPNNCVLYLVIEPCQIAAADLNGDGKLDAVLTGNAGTVEVLLNNGGGTFSATSYGGGGNSIAIGDFNGDNVPDLVTSGAFNGSTADVSVLLGNGDGTFGFPTTFPVGNNATWVALGDFRNSGKLDLAVTTGTSVAILLGNGDGTFGPAVDYPTAAGPTMVLAADFNGDGKLDLATANYTYTAQNVSILLGNGDGTFQAAVDYPIPTFGAPSFLAVGDFNGDGKPDLAVMTGLLANAQIDVSILVGNGDGTFQPAVTFGTRGKGGLAIADLNGDGAADIAVAGVSILFNRGNGPAALLAPSLLGFGNAAVGSAVSGTATLKNSGTKTLNIASITLSGPQESDFTETNTCGTSLTAGASCSFSLTFTPSALGLRTALIQIADNAFNTPQTITLSGAGVSTAPSVTLSPGILSFGNQAVGVASTSQTVTLTNTGNAALSISSISTGGANSSEFKETNTCGTSVAAAAKCAMTITFTPVATGTRSATVTITDNASNSPQTVMLSGNGVNESLGLGVAASGSSSTTVSAGQTAKYTLSIGGAGFSGTASLSCAGAPTGAACSVPSTESVSATTASSFTVSVTTTSRTSAALAPLSHSSLRWMWAFAMLGLFIIPSVPTAKRKARRMFRCLPWMLTLMICSCGGGSSSSNSPSNPNGTPAGQYTLTVTATSGSMTQSTKLTLTVQ